VWLSAKKIIFAGLRGCFLDKAEKAQVFGNNRGIAFI
jgi:hypothetical protein